MPNISVYECYLQMETTDLSWEEDFSPPSHKEGSINEVPNTHTQMDAFDGVYDEEDFFHWDTEPTWVDPSPTAKTDTSRRPSRRRNKIRKGSGRDSKTRRPDLWDFYNYQSPLSNAFCCLRRLGYNGISLVNIRKVSDIVQNNADENEIELTRRNRSAHRRKPCAFHWFDENWDSIALFYEAALKEVLGETTGVLKRGRKPKPKPIPETEDSLTSNS
jgi:hypothetical protein